MVCTGYDLKSLESLLGTAVGVGFIFPVVYQLLAERANNLLRRSKTLLAELKDKDDRFAMRDLASVQITFQSNLKKMEKESDIFIIASSFCALLSFIFLIISIYTSICLSFYWMTAIVLSVSIPILLCLIIFIKWFDYSRPLSSRCEHYYNQ